MSHEAAVLHAVPDVAGASGAHEHPLRAIEELADEALVALTSVFRRDGCGNGRLSIPPESFRRFLDMDMVQETFVPTIGAQEKMCGIFRSLAALGPRGHPMHTRFRPRSFAR